MADANVFQQYLRAPRSMLDYETDYAKADALKGQNALQALTLQQQAAATSQSLQERNALERVAMGWNAQTTPDQRSADLRNTGLSGLMTQADTLDQTRAKLLDSQSQAAKNNADAASTTQSVGQKDYTAAMQKVLSFQSPADAVASLNNAVATGKIDMKHATLMQRSIPMDDPVAFDAWKRNWAVGIADPAKMAELMAPHVNTMNTGGAQVTQAVDPITLKATTLSSLRNTQSPDNAATQAGENARAAASRAVQLQVAGIDPQNPAGPSAAALSPAAIENAAARYNLDGTLPPMAMGPRGAVGRTAIMNRAAELAVGTDPTQLRVNQMDAKSAGSALTQLSKARTMSAAFEDTANQNANLALQLSKQNDRTGIPLLNAGLQAWRTGTGSPEATQFAAANETFVNEYAKIMSGGMGNGPVSDAARSKAHTLLTTGMTDGQYEGNVRLLQQEMRNRMKGFDDQENALRARLTGKPTNSQTPATTAGGATVSSW